MAASLLRRRRSLLPSSLASLHLPRATYVDVLMKWKKDPCFDSIPLLNHARDLRPLLSLKTLISASPAATPISAVSKLNRQLEINGKVASFLRRYPSFFEEFTGPQYNLPWFKLTKEAQGIDNLEKSVFESSKVEILERLWKVILISREKVLPFRVIQGLLWNLGLPEDFLNHPDDIPEGYFEIVEIGDGENGLKAIVDPRKPLFSVIQRNAMKEFDTMPERIAIPLFPSKGLRLKRKIESWLERFQELPYVSPYEDCSGLATDSDVSEKRVVGVLHELLSLFVDCSAERRRLLCLRKHFALPQKFHKVFERHPHVFYLNLKSKTCFVVLKEAYCGRGRSAIQRHPMLKVREKYVRLMRESEVILRNRRRYGKFPKVPGDVGLDDEAVGSESREGGIDQLDEVL